MEYEPMRAITRELQLGIASCVPNSSVQELEAAHLAARNEAERFHRELQGALEGDLTPRAGTIWRRILLLLNTEIAGSPICSVCASHS